MVKKLKFAKNALRALCVGVHCLVVCAFLWFYLANSEVLDHLNRCQIKMKIVITEVNNNNTLFLNGSAMQCRRFKVAEFRKHLFVRVALARGPVPVEQHYKQIYCSVKKCENYGYRFIYIYI